MYWLKLESLIVVYDLAIRISNLVLYWNDVIEYGLGIK